MEPDVIFVGAGPVGLFTAIQAKLGNPDLNVLMLERNPSYSRGHVLRVDSDSYQGTHPDPDFQETLSDLKGFVLTTQIEESLRNYAVSLGIEIQNNCKVEDVEQLTVDYPSVHTIVGSDGAHSKVREQIFNNEKTHVKTCQYIIEVKYKILGDAQKLTVPQIAEGLSQIPHFVAENIGKKRNNETPISLFFFVNKNTYDEVRDLGRSVTLSDITAGSNSLTDLANSVHPWLAYRHAVTGERVVEGSAKVAAVALETYKSKYCVKERNGVRYVNIGDAALAVPYFRALNAGLLGGTKAARLIQQKECDNDYKNADFEADMLALAKKEINDAHWKNQKVNMGRIGANSLFIFSKGSTRDIMPTMAERAMSRARVTPFPFYRRQSRKLLMFALFLALSILLATTGGVPAIPFIGAFLAVHLGMTGASFLIGGLVALSISLFYIASTRLIRFVRDLNVTPRPLLNEEENKDFPDEIKDVESVLPVGLLSSSAQPELTGTLRRRGSRGVSFWAEEPPQGHQSKPLIEMVLMDSDEDGIQFLDEDGIQFLDEVDSSPSCTG